MPTRRMCIFAARWVLRARSLLLGRARWQGGWELTLFWSVRSSAVAHSSSIIVLHQLSNPATLA